MKFGLLKSLIIAVVVLISNLTNAATCRLDWIAIDDTPGHDRVALKVNGEFKKSYSSMIAALEEMNKLQIKCDPNERLTRQCFVFWDNIAYNIGKRAIVPGGEFSEIDSLGRALSLLSTQNFCSIEGLAGKCEVLSGLNEFVVFRNYKSFSKPYSTHNEAKDAIVKLQNFSLCEK